MEYGPDSTIDRDVPTPVSEQLAAILRARLTRGDCKPGRRFGSENGWAAEFGMSRQTVRKAIAILEAEGRVFVVPSSGTYRADENKDESDGPTV